MSITKEDIYEAEIKWHLSEVFEICKTNEIPFICVVETSTPEKGVRHKVGFFEILKGTKDLAELAKIVIMLKKDSIEKDKEYEKSIKTPKAP